jgi:ATP-binding cassette subfamily C (CFTR/MRP) protein 4
VFAYFFFLKNFFVCDNTKKFDTNFLENISFDVEANELVGIVGPVGAGKSTLLLALSSEIKDLTGNLDLNGRIFYIPQEPWVYSATVKENIIFGNPYDEMRFNEILEACALTQVFN